MHRLANPITLAAMVAASQASAAMAQTSTTRVILRGKADTTVAKTDSIRVEHGLINIRRVDSLLKQQEDLPIGSSEYARIQRELETMILATRTLGPDGAVTIVVGSPGMEPTRAPAFAARAFVDVTPRGWFGFTADGLQRTWTEPEGFYVQHFEYPTVLEVDPDSPASKVGIKFGDVLLAYAGADLLTRPINLTRLLVPGRSVSIKVRRNGEAKEFSLSVDKAPPALLAERRVAAVGRMLMPSRAPMSDTVAFERRAVEQSRVTAAAGGARGVGGVAIARAPIAVGMLVPSGYLGAQMVDLDAAALATISSEKSDNGVLVTVVPPGTPAARIGMRGGDLIVNIDDVPVVSMSQLRRELMIRGDRAIQLSVLRKGKIEKLSFDPR
jgi:membrane-associated protease RseP (regulator of RpoE activity)